MGINVTHANYWEKRKYENFSVINIYEKLNVDIKYMRFCISKRNWDTDFNYSQNDFGNSKKLGSVVNVFVFLIKTSCQSKESHSFPGNPSSLV